MNLAQAKLRLTVPFLWNHFCFEGEASKSCRCPFHEDRNPSFSITPDGSLWNCFGGCGGGDAINFFAQASGLPHAEACRAFIALAGVVSTSSLPRLPRPANAKLDTEAFKSEQRKSWPRFETPFTGDDDLHSRAVDLLAKLRQVSRRGLYLAASRGLLWFAAWKDSPAWIVTDSARLNAQARRMDGSLWNGIEAKAQTLPGSKAAWPIGADEARYFPIVLLVEGAPDLLAAHHFIHVHGREADTATAAMLGAGNSIPDDALQFFASKRIRIMAHADEAGRHAAARWAEQLASVGAAVDALDFSDLLMADGSPANDLNDLTQMDPKQTHELSNLIPHEIIEP